jgi:hypothetical protein
MKTFKENYDLEINEFVEVLPKGDNGGGDLSYLSWAYALKLAREEDPTFTFKVIKTPTGDLVHESKAGLFVMTEVSYNGTTYEMFLPVMDTKNNAMTFQEQVIERKKKDGSTYNTIIPAANAMNINKTIMRCLVKNIAYATGIGLKLYAGEDLDKEELSINNMKSVAFNAVKKLKDEETSIIIAVGDLLKDVELRNSVKNTGFQFNSERKVWYMRVPKNDIDKYLKLIPFKTEVV